MAAAPPLMVLPGDQPQEMDDKVYVAVGKDAKEAKPLLQWAMSNFPRERQLVIVHVHCPSKVIPFLGSSILASQLDASEVASHTRMEMQMMNERLDQYVHLCASEDREAEKLLLESDEVTDGIVELVWKHHITTLVMGTSTDRYSIKKPKVLKSLKALTVKAQAAFYCSIWFVSKGKLVSIRGATTVGPYSLQFDGARFSSNGSPESKSCDLFSSLSNTISEVSSLTPDIETTDCEDDIGEGHDALLKLKEVFTEIESLVINLRQEKRRRLKAERDLLEALNKTEIQENLYIKETKTREEIEGALTRITTELENTRKQKDDYFVKLQKEHEQRVNLEKQNAHCDRIIKDLIVQRDNALNETEELRQKRGAQTARNSVHIAEFSMAELSEATSGFSDSNKLGEGAYGSVYKGSLRNTIVAVKKLSYDYLGLEFNQEVEVLSRVRHPNLVTLLGTCPEAHALVYEFMPNGSLEDRLFCKNNTKPLSWQLRCRIISEVCSALMFLHSFRPSSVVHGDLKPANILLDANYVSKISDFGICRFSEDFRTTTTLYRHTHPKGTFVYMDPEYLTAGEFTTSSDIYSFGVIVLQLLTGRSGLRLLKDVEQALDKDCFPALLDPSAGVWPVMQAEQLARIGLRCCDIRRRNRPNLQRDVWGILQSLLKASSSQLSSSSFKSVSEELKGIPSCFICPILQDVMRDPLIAADGFTYEADAIRRWFESGHHTSPMTNLELPHRELIPNHALRSAIQEWLQQEV